MGNSLHFVVLTRIIMVQRIVVRRSAAVLCDQVIPWDYGSLLCLYEKLEDGSYGYVYHKRSD